MIQYYLDEFYWRAIEQKKAEAGNANLYKESLIEVLGKEVSFEDVMRLDRNLQMKIMISLENKILLNNSPIDVSRLAKVIQDSRSGFGGCAMTSFFCSFCGEEEVWSNTAVPNICKQCATKMAEYISKHLYRKILKDGYFYGS